MKREKKTCMVRLRVAKSVRDELQRTATEEGSTISQVVRRVIMEWVRENAPVNRLKPVPFAGPVVPKPSPGSKSANLLGLYRNSPFRSKKRFIRELLSRPDLLENVTDARTVNAEYLLTRLKYAIQRSKNPDK